MKRLHFTLLFFIACLVVAGCRRGGSGVPRDPVDLRKESDLVKGTRESSFSFLARSPQMREQIWWFSPKEFNDELARRTDKSQKKDFLKDIASKQKAATDQKGASPEVSKKQKDASKAQADIDFSDFAGHCYSFLNENKTMVNKYTMKNFFLYAHREKASIKHTFLDGVSFELAIEEIPVKELIAGGKMAFVPYADLNQPDYVIAYSQLGEAGQHRAMLSNKEEKFFSMADVASVATRQELKLIAAYRAAYADGLRVDQKPTLAELHDYLKEKAPGQIMRDLEEKWIALNPKVDLLDPNQILACHTQVELDRDNKNAPKGYLCVNCRGNNIQYLPKKALPWMPEVTLKRGSGPSAAGPGGGMPGIPGGPDMPIP